MAARRADDPSINVPPEDEQDAPGDPESVARAICLRLLTQRARSRAELAEALHRRGVPDDAASAVLTRYAEVGLIDDDSEREAAYRLVARKLPALRGLPEQTQARRLVGLLARRGYSPSMAGDVVREALAGWIGPGVADDLVAD